MNTNCYSELVGIYDSDLDDSDHKPKRQRRTRLGLIFDDDSISSSSGVLDNSIVYTGDNTTAKGANTTATGAITTIYGQLTEVLGDSIVYGIFSTVLFQILCPVLKTPRP